MFASKGKVTSGDEVNLSGQIFSAGSEPCAGRDQFVRLQRRTLGTSEFVNFKSTLTNAEGRFSFDVEVVYSSEYIAVAPAHDRCAAAQSSAVRVLARGRVSIKANDKTPERGSLVRITGAVSPNHRNTKVRLQQKRGGGWETVLGDRLDRRSRYVFEFEATGPKSQRYRVRWLGSDENEPGTSKELQLRLHN